MIVVNTQIYQIIIDKAVKGMSLRRNTTISSGGQPFYYIYLHNLPNKYITSNIFPEVILSQEIREDIIQQEIHPDHNYCWFGFRTKQISSKFQRQMRNLLPSFVVISRRHVEVSQELKDEKTNYDQISGQALRPLDFIYNRTIKGPSNKTLRFSIFSQTEQLSSSNSETRQTLAMNNVRSPRLREEEKTKQSQFGLINQISNTCRQFLTGNKLFGFLWKK